MNSTQELLDALRARAGSDRKAAAQLGISQAVFSRYRTGRDFPGDETARRVAELLQLGLPYVLAIVHRDRAKSDETRAAWSQLAEKFKDAAVIAALAFGAASFGMPAPAQAMSHNSNSATAEYTLHHKRRRPRGALAAAARWITARR